MYSRDGLFLRSLDGSFGIYFPRCFATREMNTKITLSWALETVRHSSTYIIIYVLRSGHTYNTMTSHERRRLSINSLETVFIPQFVQAFTGEHINALYHCPFVRGILLHKWIMWKTLSCHDMTSSYATRCLLFTTTENDDDHKLPSDLWLAVRNSRDAIRVMMTSPNGNIFRVMVYCAGHSLVTGKFPTQRPVTRSFGVFFDPRLNKRLHKQSTRWWSETPSRSLWRHCNVTIRDPRTDPQWLAV